MKGNVKFVLGKTEYQLAMDGEKDMELLHKMSVLGNPPRYCGDCKNGEFFRLDSNKDKEANIYVNVICTKCGAKAKLGQYKAGGYFWHKFEKYQKDGATTKTAESEPANEPTDVPKEDEDQIPF